MSEDLISRQAAIEVLRNRWLKTRNYEGIGEDIAEECEIYLKTLPSAQRTGKWIIRDNSGTGWYRVTCSECGEDVTSTAPCIGFFPNAKVTWNYCPYCGAKMDGEGE